MQNRCLFTSHAEQPTSSIKMIDNVLIIKELLLNVFWSPRRNLGRKPNYDGRCSPGLIESETGALMWSTPIPHGWTQSHQTMKERTEPADSSPQASLTENCTRNQIQELNSAAKPIEMKWLSVGQWNINTCCCVQTILAVQRDYLCAKLCRNQINNTSIFTIKKVLKKKNNTSISALVFGALRFPGG